VVWGNCGCSVLYARGAYDESPDRATRVFRPSHGCPCHQGARSQPCHWSRLESAAAVYCHAVCLLHNESYVQSSQRPKLGMGALHFMQWKVPGWVRRLFMGLVRRPRGRFFLVLTRCLRPLLIWWTSLWHRDRWCPSSSSWWIRLWHALHTGVRSLRRSLPMRL
jgi:hypothetical protein